MFYLSSWKFIPYWRIIILISETEEINVFFFFFFCLLCEMILHSVIDHMLWGVRSSHRKGSLVPTSYLTIFYPALPASQGNGKEEMRCSVCRHVGNAVVTSRVRCPSNGAQSKKHQPNPHHCRRISPGLRSHTCSRPGYHRPTSKRPRESLNWVETCQRKD